MSCEYYVQLGTAFPHRSLAAALQLVNRSNMEEVFSPVAYSYYWAMRQMGPVLCWEEEQSAGSHCSPGAAQRQLCPGPKGHAPTLTVAGARAESGGGAAGARAGGGGELLPRSSCSAHVHVPDVGARLGVQRAVLM
ncbi:hypothetical protein HF086_002200 [Spodoptera exigua]|uniref:Uncharacterized protein n=1 Tax=Spodoptera exigua TaxID=7107 RepID=A0A922ML09_SPOEX|nr:hypothetical protein HF086_002200 [Spodoptera exigua]